MFDAYLCSVYDIFCFVLGGRRAFFLSYSFFSLVRVIAFSVDTRRMYFDMIMIDNE